MWPANRIIKKNWIEWIEFQSIQCLNFWRIKQIHLVYVITVITKRRLSNILRSTMIGLEMWRVIYSWEPIHNWTVLNRPELIFKNKEENFEQNFETRPQNSILRLLFSILLYSVEAWTASETSWKRLEAFKIWPNRRIIKITTAVIIIKLLLWAKYCFTV